MDIVLPANEAWLCDGPVTVRSVHYFDPPKLDGVPAVSRACPICQEAVVFDPWGAAVSCPHCGVSLDPNHDVVYDPTTGEPTEYTWLSAATVDVPVPGDLDDLPPDKQLVLLRAWRANVVARASRAGRPAGTGLCDWFEELASRAREVPCSSRPSR